MKTGPHGWSGDEPRRLVRAVSLCVGVLLAWAGLLGAAEREVVVLRGLTMGSTWSVKFSPGVAMPPVRDVERALQAKLDALERQMSTWRADSDVSRFNASTGANWFPVPRETVVVVQEALAVSALTDGAFDVTVFPLVRLWGFGPGGGKGRVPTEAEIAAALRQVGWRKLHARLDPPALRKDAAGLAVDLSALGPGFASDCLGERLEAWGVRDYLVEVGGEFRARGNGALGPGWRVGVERPAVGAGRSQSQSLNDISAQSGDYKPPARAFAAIVTLNNQSLATSGDYRNFFTVGSRRFSHHLNPRTGRPVDSGIASVSVIHASTMRADALGTALTVMGFERARALAEREKLGVFLTLRDGDKLEVRATAHWPAAAKVE